MKYKDRFSGLGKISRTLAIATILCLLLITIPATPALAAESLNISPSSGEIGEDIDVWGSGYDPGDIVYIYFTSEEAEEGDDVEDLDAYERVKSTHAGSRGEVDEGDIDTYFDIPSELEDGDVSEDVHGGDYFVYTTYTKGGSILAVEEFTVTDIELDRDQGYVGDAVVITGIGFTKNKDITVKFDDDEDLCDRKTDSRGEFTCTIVIPNSTAGDHTISVKVHYTTVEAEFTVSPKITISPQSGSIGDTITVNGTGFGKRKSITIYFNNDIVSLTSGTATTDSYGSFSNLIFNAPIAVPGTCYVKAEDTSRNTDTETFTITCYATINPVTGHVGTEISIDGTGFIPGGTATIKYYITVQDTEVTTATIGTDGTLTATLIAPASNHGAHSITVSDGANTKTLIFTMESTPPSPVYPLLPDMDGSLKGWKFDWGGDADDPTIEVTDDSLPITYTLQVAADENFTEDSLVLEKPDLTTSEYVVTTREEKDILKQSAKSAPYYWRVKAIDAAANETAWTDTRTFYVGFTFPSWGIYTLIGLGGLLLLVLSFWLGRKTAYS